MKIQSPVVTWTAILAISFVQFGCEKKESHRRERGGAHESDAHHEHTAPHGGTLVVLGEEFAHVEFVLEKATGKLTGYVLDSEAEKPVRLSQGAIELKIDRLNSGHTVALHLIAVANVLTGETQGDTSHFAGQSDELIGATEFHAAFVAIAVKGQTFVDVDFEFPDGNEGGGGDHHEH
jgi:hypothetical protein